MKDKVTRARCGGDGGRGETETARKRDNPTKREKGGGGGGGRRKTSERYCLLPQLKLTDENADPFWM